MVSPGTRQPCEGLPGENAAGGRFKPGSPTERLEQLPNPLPYFRWFPADAETDEHYTAMTDQELGFFHRCLNRSWRNNGLPAELQELSKAMRVDMKYLGRVWPRVGKRFYEDNGRLFNRRQEDEREHANSKSERNTRAVRTRYERSTNAPTNEPQQARAPADSASDSGSSSNGLHKENARATPVVGFEMDEEFNLIISAFLAAGVKLSEPQVREAATEWVSLEPSQRVGAVASAQERAKKHEARFMGLPASWLRKRQWMAVGPGRILPEPMGKAELAQETAERNYMRKRGML